MVGTKFEFGLVDAGELELIDEVQGLLDHASGHPTAIVRASACPPSTNNMPAIIWRRSPGLRPRWGPTLPLEVVEKAAEK